MALNRLLDDPEVHALISRVEEAYGPDAVGKAIERAYAALAREQRAGKMTEESPLQAMRGALRRELETLMREH